MAYFARYMLDEHGNMRKVVINAGVGFCLPYYGETAPPGTLACDGGMFVRGTGGNAAELGVEQEDAIRNISGAIMIRGTRGNSDSVGPAEGAFSYEAVNKAGLQFEFSSTQGTYAQNIIFTASNAVPVAVENRPVNVALLWCIIYE